MELMTKTEVCQKLKVSTRTIELWVHEGRFPPAVQIGKSVYWASEAVDKWQENLFKKQLAWKPRI